MKLVLKDHKIISWNKLYSSKHWAYRKKLADEIHALVRYSLLDADIKQIFTKPVHITITAHIKDKRRHDPDNVCSKLYIDGLVSYGILEDDDDKHVASVTTQIERSNENKVIININEV